MCGIFGKTNFNQKADYKLFKESLELIKCRGLDEYGYYFDNFVSFGHRRLCVIDKENGKQPYIFNDLKMVYNGEIYNIEELRNDLLKKGYSFIGHSDTELLIKCYNEYKLDVFNKLNGIFSLAIIDGNKLILGRDRLGVKPLYYTIFNDDIVFASEIKSIINYTNYRTVSKEGLRMLLAASPMSDEGKTIYDNIYQLPRASYMIFDGNIKINRYWNIEAKDLKISYDDAKKYVRKTLDDAIKIQSVADVKVGAFLSGGIDSSIVYSILKDYIADLESFCLDYEDNKIEYKNDEFNISRDQDYIKYLHPKNHKEIIISNKELLENLKSSLKARDYPGMADIDSSMLYLCRKIKEDVSVCLSGECADEIFGGYPWFFKEFDTFPWIRNLDTKEKLLNIDLDLKGYINDLYKKAINNVSYLDNDSKEMKDKRLSMILNIDYFMQNMLERKDRMSMYNNLEVRVPFCDYRLVEFMYNVKPEYMNYKMEKSLLRDAYSDVLPKEILNRKKSPYPKTHSSKYLDMIKDEVFKILDDDNSILNIIFKKDKIKELASVEFKPFYGQLMTLQSFYGFLYQLDYWYKEYKINLVL